MLLMLRVVKHKNVNLGRGCPDFRGVLIECFTVLTRPFYVHGYILVSSELHSYSDS